MSAEQTAAELTTRDVLLQVDRRLTLIEGDLRSLDEKVETLDTRLSTRIEALDLRLSAKLDDKIDGFHYYTTYIKFGLGRASYDASQEIRNHHLTRQEGVALVRRFDGEFPEKYFSEILSSLEIKPERFLALCDNFRPAHLWEKVEGKWRLRHPVV